MDPLKKNEDGTPVRRSPFKTILNFRDLGQSINGLQSQMTEHTQQGKDYDAKIRQLAVNLQSEDSVNSMKIPNIQYHEINLNGSAYERTLLKRMKYLSLAKLISLMALGRRTQAISVLGKEVIQPGGLVGQAKDTIDSSGIELKRILEILSNAGNYPIYFHCTQGKDRTGLVALLLLVILNIPLDIIAVDYMASEGELLPERGDRIQELRAMGLSDDFANCPPNWVADVYHHITCNYGSSNGYFNCIGVGRDLRQKIKSNLLETPIDET
ncbi:MAG: hypothetical protein L6R37_003695 [Teloschistes peruensis]|nr:MAG: hypothetical protein L6R37_003695 [Teloschistes peruensis]